MAAFDNSKRSVVKHRTHTPFAPGRGGHGSSSGSGSHGGRGGRGGFKVGPSHAPDGAYLGKAKKIKANLIANAKTKKRFFKTMAGEQGAVDTRGKSRAQDQDDDLNKKDNDRGNERVRSASATKQRTTRSRPASSLAPSPFFQRPDLGRFAREGDDEDEEVLRGPTVDSRISDKGVSEDATQRRRDRAGPSPFAGANVRSAGNPSAKPRKRARPDPSSDQGEPSRVSSNFDIRQGPAEAPVQGGTTAGSTRSLQQPHRTKEEAVEARRKRQEMWNSTTKGGPRTQRCKGGQPDLGKRMQVLLGQIEETK